MEITFRLGVSTEIENVRKIIIIDVQDLQRHYGRLIAKEINRGGTNIASYSKMFNDCNNIIGLLEGLEDPTEILKSA